MRAEQDGYVLQNAEFKLSGNHGKRMSQASYVCVSDYLMAIQCVETVHIARYHNHDNMLNGVVRMCGALFIWFTD